jgi:hypothetical protein
MRRTYGSGSPSIRFHVNLALVRAVCPVYTPKGCPAAKATLIPKRRCVLPAPNGYLPGGVLASLAFG